MHKIRSLISIIFIRRKKQFLLIQALLLLNAFMELAGVASVVPFLAVVVAPEVVAAHRFYVYLQELSDFFGGQDLAVILGSVAFVLVVLSNLASGLSLWVVQKFALAVGEEFSVSLLSYYLNLGFIDHVKVKSSLFTKNILQETTRLTNYILVPLMHINVHFLALCIVIVSLFVVNFKIALAILLTLGGGFLTIAYFFKDVLSRNSSQISSAGLAQYSSINHGFAGIREIKLHFSESVFVKSFQAATKKLNRAILRNYSMTVLPSYMVQSVTFGLVCLFVVMVKVFEAEEFVDFAQVMFFAVSGYKILPILRQIYYNSTYLRGHASALDEILPDLDIVIRSKSIHEEPIVPKHEFSNFLCLRNVAFSYREGVSVLEGINVNFHKGEVVGFAGPSGGGKTTLMDVISGLLEPSKGQILIDRVPVTEPAALRNLCSYVSQGSYIFEGTILENICFGQSEDKYNVDLAEEAVQKASLGEWISSFPEGIHAYISEAGRNMSGGQKQRLAIARAFYHQSEILIFDEFTSALDGETESEIIREVLKYGQVKTVFIVAHRLSTLKNCDRILVLKDGQIVEEGNYDTLMKLDRGTFQQMAYLGGFVEKPEER